LNQQSTNTQESSTNFRSKIAQNDSLGNGSSGPLSNAFPPTNDERNKVPIHNTSAVIQNNSHNQTDPRPKYFAVCIPAGGIYKALIEIDTSIIKSDDELFLAIKQVYQNERGCKAWRCMFLKPVSIEFVQV
jgi:hypothetical protein